MPQPVNKSPLFPHPICARANLGSWRVSYPDFIAAFSTAQGALWTLSGRKQTTIEYMHFAIFAMRVLEVMFFAGLAGSAVVVLISFYEDAIELFGRD